MSYSKIADEAVCLPVPSVFPCFPCLIWPFFVCVIGHILSYHQLPDHLHHPQLIQILIQYITLVQTSKLCQTIQSLLC